MSTKERPAVRNSDARSDTPRASKSNILRWSGIKPMRRLNLKWAQTWSKKFLSGSTGVRFPVHHDPYEVNRSGNRSWKHPKLLIVWRNSRAVPKFSTLRSLAASRVGPPLLTFQSFCPQAATTDDGTDLFWDVMTIDHQYWRVNHYFH